MSNFPYCFTIDDTGLAVLCDWLREEFENDTVLITVIKESK